MLEILILLVVIPGIAALAKGRGADRWLAGSIALCGFLAIRLGSQLFVTSSDGLLFSIVAAWIWIACVAVWYRFMVGTRRPQPTGMWLCTNCTYTNKQYALSCAACGKAWSPPAEA
jgi:hypothetical protein